MRRRLLTNAYDRHGHSQVGFALPRTGGPHAKGDGVGADGGEVLFLAQRFGVDGAAFGGNGDKIIVQFPQALFLAAMTRG